MAEAKKKKSKKRTSTKKSWKRIPRQKIKREETQENTFAVIKKSFLDIGRSFSQGADEIADLLIEKSQKDKGEKFKKIKEALVSRVKKLGTGAKRSLKNLKPRDVLCDTSYEIGKLSKAVKNTCVEIFNDLMEWNTDNLYPRSERIMKREAFRDLGQSFYGWYKTSRLKFIYGTDGKGLNKEIEHISELIEYVERKRQSLSS